MNEIEVAMENLKTAMKAQAREELIREIANSTFLVEQPSAPRARANGRERGAHGNAKKFDDAVALSMMPCPGAKLVERFGIGRVGVWSNLNRLRKAGIVRKVGDKGGTTWHRVEPKA